MQFVITNFILLQNHHCRLKKDWRKMNWLHVTSQYICGMITHASKHLLISNLVEHRMVKCELLWLLDGENQCQGQIKGEPCDHSGGFIFYSALEKLVKTLTLLWKFGPVWVQALRTSTFSYRIKIWSIFTVNSRYLVLGWKVEIMINITHWPDKIR